MKTEKDQGFFPIHQGYKTLCERCNTERIHKKHTNGNGKHKLICPTCGTETNIWDIPTSIHKGRLSTTEHILNVYYSEIEKTDSSIKKLLSEKLESVKNYFEGKNEETRKINK